MLFDLGFQEVCGFEARESKVFRPHKQTVVGLEKEGSSEFFFGGYSGVQAIKRKPTETRFFGGVEFWGCLVRAVGQQKGVW